MKNTLQPYLIYMTIGKDNYLKKGYTAKQISEETGMTTQGAYTMKRKICKKAKEVI